MICQILDRHESAVGIANYITVHGRDDAEHDQHLHRFIHIIHAYGLVLKPENSMVKVTSVTFLVMSLFHNVFTLTL